MRGSTVLGYVRVYLCVAVQGLTGDPGARGPKGEQGDTGQTGRPVSTTPTP